MKVLFINNIFPPGFIGGYELGALDVANAFFERGHSVHVLTSDYFIDEANELAHLNVERSLYCEIFNHEASQQNMYKAFYFNFRNIRILGRAIRQIKPDVILAFNLHGLGPISLIQFLESARIPTLYYFMDNPFNRSFPFDKRYNELFGELKLDGNKVIAMSQNIVREIGVVVPLSKQPITFVPGWVFVNEAVNPGPIANDTVKFLFCSRIAAHKGIDIVIDAVENLKRAGYGNFTVDIFGAGSVAELSQSIKKRKLEEIIRYRGVLGKNKMLAAFRNFDALLFPTWKREAFGFVASEAAAAGCIPILTAGIGASEWLLDDLDCIKIERNHNALSAAMIEVMLWQPEERLRRRQSTSETAKTIFSFNRWLPIIEGKCIEAVGMRDAASDTKGNEAALIYLHTLLKERERLAH